MKTNKLSWIVRGIAYGCMEVLTFLPILLTIAIYTIDSHSIWIWIGSIPILYLGGRILIRCFKKHRIIAIILCGLISGAYTYLLFGMAGVRIIYIFIVAFIYMYRGILSAEQPWDMIFPEQMFWIGILMYFTASFLYGRIQSLAEFSKWINIAAYIYIPLVFFLLNRRQLENANLSRGEAVKIQPNVIKQNRRLIVLNMLIVIFISSFNQLKTWIEKGLSLLGGWIYRFILFLNSLLDSSSAPIESEGGIPQIEPFTEPTEPSLFSRILDIIFSVIAIILLFILIFFACKIIYKGIKKLIKKLEEIGKNRAIYEQPSGYIDEKESLIDIKKMGRDYVDRVKKWLANMLSKGLKWDELKNNSERVRYIYIKMVLRAVAEGYSLKIFLTPRELQYDLSNWYGERQMDIEPLISLYYTARYSLGDISDAQVDSVKKLL